MHTDFRFCFFFYKWDFTLIRDGLIINSYHSPTKFLQPANLTTHTILSLFSLQVELAPRLLSP